MAPKTITAVRDFIVGPTRRSATTSLHQPPPPPPPYLALRSSTAFITFAVCLAIFTDIFFYGLIVPVIPFSLTAQVGIPDDEIQQWTAVLLACYNATLFVGSPFAGWYADHTSSRRWPFLLGLFALAGSTLLLCLGTTIWMLVLGRLLQGLSAAVVWSVGLALLVDTMGKDVGQAMGYVNIAIAIGLLISPVIGGAVYAGAGYYAVYYVAFALICCDIALRLVLIEKKVAQQWLEPPCAAAIAGAGTEDTDSHLDSVPVQAGGIPGRTSADGPSPGLTERRHRPHWDLIKSKRVMAVLVGVVIEGVIVYACDTVLPIFVKDTFHWNSTAAGLIFICLMVPAFASPLVGILGDRYGAKWLTFTGFALSIPLLVCLRFVTDNTIQHKVLLCALLVLLGATVTTLANTPLLAAMTYAIDEKEVKHPGRWGEKGVYGIAYGLWTMAFALGGTIGSIMSGYINNGPGWGTLTWTLALWSTAGSVVAFGLGSKPRTRDKEQSSPADLEPLPATSAGAQSAAL